MPALTTRYTLGTLAGLTVLVLAGCQKDEITSYKVPKVEQPDKLRYRVPDHWIEQKGPALVRSRGGIQIKFEALFVVGEGDKSAEVTVSADPTRADQLLPNVNRWRAQVQLDPLDEKKLNEEVKPLSVAGSAAHYVDLLGPESAGPKRLRTLGVILPRGPKTWFFKFSGPPDLIAKERSAFETFMQSVRFGGDPGANDG